MFSNSKHTDSWKPQQKIGLMTLHRQRRFMRGASCYYSVSLNYAKWRRGPPKNRLWPTIWEPLV